MPEETAISFSLLPAPPIPEMNTASQAGGQGVRVYKLAVIMDNPLITISNLSFKGKT